MVNALEKEALLNVQAAKGREKPRKVVIITDPGRDHDDEQAFTILRGLEKCGLVEVQAVITNLSPPETVGDQRARLARGAFKSLQFAHLPPVAIGSNDNPEYKPEDHEFAATYLASPEDVEPDGQALLKKTFLEAADAGDTLDLILISGMQDARDFIQENLPLAKQVIGKVTIMGGVQVTGDTIKLDDNDCMIPDTAYNNIVDKPRGEEARKAGLSPTDAGPAAKDLYEILQKGGFEMQIVTRHAASAAAVPPAFYDDLAETGHEVALRLKRDQKASIQRRWEEYMNNPIVERLNRMWFASQFTHNPATKMVEMHFDLHNVWKYVTRLSLYDGLAVMKDILPESISEQLFEPTIQEVAGRTHQIVGVSAEKHGIRDVAKVHTMLSALAHFGLSKEQEIEQLPVQERQPVPVDGHALALEIEEDMEKQKGYLPAFMLYYVENGAIIISKVKGLKHLLEEARRWTSIGGYSPETYIFETNPEIFDNRDKITLLQALEHLFGIRAIPGKINQQDFTLTITTDDPHVKMYIETMILPKERERGGP